MQSYFVGIAQASLAVAGSDRYAGLDGALAASATEAIAQQVMPDARDLDSFFVKIQTAPGASKTLTLTVRKNGVDTAITVTLTGTGTGAGITFGSYTGASVSFAAGDKISVLVRLTSGGTLPTSFSWTCRQTGTGQAVLFNSAQTQITTTTFAAPAGGGAVSATESAVYAPCPIAGQVTAIYAMSDANPSPGNWQIAVRLNATTDTAATVNIPSGQTAGATVNATGLTVAVAAGDLLSIHMTAAASPASSRIAGAYVIVPTTAGESCMLGSTGSTVGTAADNYLLAHGNRAGAVATSEVIGLPMAYLQACTIKAMYVKMHAAPGAAKSYDVTARLNATTDTAATVNITGAATTTGSITGLTVAVVNTDTLDVKTHPSASAPAAARIHTGIAYTLDATKIVAPAGVAAAATVSCAVVRNRTLWNTVG